MFLAIPMFIFLGIVLPLLGWASLRRAGTAADSLNEKPSAGAVAAQLGILQTVVACLGLLALHGTGVELAWLSALTPATLIVSIAALAGFIAIAVLESKRTLGPNENFRAELRKTSARNPAWITVVLYAGVVEEFAYRGVLTLTLATITGYWPAAIASALAFGLGHLSGGWRTAAIGVLFALVMQVIVYLSGGLLLAVIVHAAYDLVATWLGHRIARRGNGIKQATPEYFDR